MEERLVDKDDERLIRLKKTAEGTDAQDALAEDNAEEVEEEVLVTLPDGEEYDEDLVGLTPSQLAKELARRKKAEEEARAECQKLVAVAEEALAAEDYERAASFFAQATCYSFADAGIVKGLWQARTKNYTDLSPFFNKEYAEEFAVSDEEAKAAVREKVKEELDEKRTEVKEEIEKISPSILEKQEERRQAFLANRRYYAVIFMILFGVTAAFIVGLAVSASYIVRTLSILPVVLTACFGGLALVAFFAAFALLVKFSGANRLCRVNEKLSATEEGAHLVELQERLECLDLILEENAE